MNNSPRARNPREFDEGNRPFLVSRPAGNRVRTYNEIASPRLIYFDQRRAIELLEDVGSTIPGRKFLEDITKHIEINSISVLKQQNLRAILSHLMMYETREEVETIISLYQPGSAYSHSSWEKFHPDQAVVIRGAVASAKDVRPSSLQLNAGEASVRVYVERDHFLHLNQKYLTSRTITAVGKVRSVPRNEICAAAIGTPIEDAYQRVSAGT